MVPKQQYSVIYLLLFSLNNATEYWVKRGINFPKNRKLTLIYQFQLKLYETNQNETVELD